MKNGVIYNPTFTSLKNPHFFSRQLYIDSFFNRLFQLLIPSRHHKLKTKNTKIKQTIFVPIHKLETSQTENTTAYFPCFNFDATLESLLRTLSCSP